MKKLLSVLLAFVLTMITLIGCSPSAKETNSTKSEPASASQPTSQPVVFKLSHNFTNEQPLHITMLEVAENIKNRTNGAVTIEVYSNAEIANGLDGVEQCIRGANFINVYDPSCMENWVPDYNALIGPMLYASQEEYSKMCQSDFANSLNGKASENGIKVLALDYTFGLRNLATSKKVITSLADLKNMKLRVPKSQLWVTTFEALGANPVPISWSELYNAVQQGVVEGFETSISDMYDNQMFEVIKHISLTNHFIGTAAVMTSQKAFDQLTPEQQKIFEEEFVAGAIRNNERIQKVEEDARKAMAEKGVEIHEVEIEPFREASKKFFETFPGLTPGVYDTIAAEMDKIRK